MRPAPPACSLKSVRSSTAAARVDRRGMRWQVKCGARVRAVFGAGRPRLAAAPAHGRVTGFMSALRQGYVLVRVRAVAHVLPTRDALGWSTDH